jgi:hypothetical protein
LQAQSSASARCEDTMLSSPPTVVVLTILFLYTVGVNCISNVSSAAPLNFGPSLYWYEPASMKETRDAQIEF